MSCGGDGHGGTSGFGAMVSTVASLFGVPIAAARKRAHASIAAKRQSAHEYPQPSRKEVVDFLNDFAERTASLRDREARSKGPDGKKIPAARWQGYIESMHREIQRAKTDKDYVLPSGEEFAAWKELPSLVREFSDQNRCKCGKFISPYGGGEHKCLEPSQDSAPRKSAPKTQAPAQVQREEAASSADAPTIVLEPANIDLRSLIRESQMEEKAQRQAAQSNPKPIELPKSALYIGPTLNGVNPPTNMSFRDRLVRAFFGIHRCDACGQFVGQNGHYCFPVPQDQDHTATQEIPVVDPVDDHPTQEYDLDEMSDQGPSEPDYGYEYEPEYYRRPEIGRAASTAGRFTSRILLSPKGWRVMAPYAFRAALIATPLVLTAGMTLAPLAMIFAVVMLARTPKWFNKRRAEDYQTLSDHYNKPFFWQRWSNSIQERRERKASQGNYGNYDDYDYGNSNPDAPEQYDPYVPTEEYERSR